MGRLLLTSSQVGVVFSAIVVIVCTFALFFAGYTLQQNTVIQLREAIKPRALPIRTQLVSPDAGAEPSAKEDAFPKYVEIEVVHGPLEADEGQAWKDDGEGDGDLPQEFSTNFPGAGASDDVASFADRRKADKLKAKIPAEAEPQGQQQQQVATAPVKANTPVSKYSPGPILGSIMAEARKRFGVRGDVPSGEDAERVAREVDPRDMSTASRRKMFLAQLAMGQSPEVIKKPFDYRRRSWLDGK